MEILLEELWVPEKVNFLQHHPHRGKSFK
jgi:hypothetical protein